MRPILLALFSVLTLSAFPQEFGKQLQANKWYINGGLIRKSVLLNAKAADAKDLWEAKFLTTGKLMRCDTVKGSLFTGEGKETRINMVECDSGTAYLVNKDMIRISAGKNQYYYKIKTNTGKGFELMTITAEEFK